MRCTVMVCGPPPLDLANLLLQTHMLPGTLDQPLLSSATPTHASSLRAEDMQVLRYQNNQTCEPGACRRGLPSHALPHLLRCAAATCSTWPAMQLQHPFMSPVVFPRRRRRPLGRPGLGRGAGAGAGRRIGPGGDRVAVPLRSGGAGVGWWLRMSVLTEQPGCNSLLGGWWIGCQAEPVEARADVACQATTSCRRRLMLGAGRCLWGPLRKLLGC